HRPHGPGADHDHPIIALHHPLQTTTFCIPAALVCAVGTRVVYQTFEISNIEGWNSSSTATLRSIKPCSWAYCFNAVISRIFSSMPEGQKCFPMSGMVSWVSAIRQGSVTISALTSRRSVMASALASQNAL